MEGQLGTRLGLVGVEICDNSEDGSEFFHFTACVEHLVKCDHFLHTALDLQGVGQQVEDKGQVDISEVNEVLYLGYVNLLDVHWKLVTEEPWIIEVLAQNFENQ